MRTIKNATKLANMIPPLYPIGWEKATISRNTETTVANLDRLAVVRRMNPMPILVVDGISPSPAIAKATMTVHVKEIF